MLRYSVGPYCIYVRLHARRAAQWTASVRKRTTTSPFVPSTIPGPGRDIRNVYVLLLICAISASSMNIEALTYIKFLREGQRNQAN